MFHKYISHYWGKGRPHRHAFSLFITNPFEGEEGGREIDLDKVNSFRVNEVGDKG